MALSLNVGTQRTTIIINQTDSRLELPEDVTECFCFSETSIIPVLLSHDDRAIIASKEGVFTGELSGDNTIVSDETYHHVPTYLSLSYKPLPIADALTTASSYIFTFQT